MRRYNEFCKTGGDEDFGKPAGKMIPIEKPPFYAIFGKMATDGAIGGILINEKTEAYRKDGKGVVPGLYATGDNSSGWAACVKGDGDARKFILSEMSWACTSGYIAGTNAGEYIKVEIAVRQIKERRGGCDVQPASVLCHAGKTP